MWRIIAWLLLLTSGAIADYRILRFEAEWCGSCAVLRNQIDTPQAQTWLTEFGVTVVHVDFDEHPQQAVNYKVGALPTCVLVDVDRNNKATVVRRHVGTMTVEQFMVFATPPAQ